MMNMSGATINTSSAFLNILIYSLPCFISMLLFTLGIYPDLLFTDVVNPTYVAFWFSFELELGDLNEMLWWMIEW